MKPLQAMYWVINWVKKKKKKDFAKQIKLFHRNPFGRQVSVCIHHTENIADVDVTTAGQSSIFFLAGRFEAQKAADEPSMSANV